MNIRKLSILISVLMAIIGVSCGQYQLEFDWKLSGVSTDIEYAYVTWNGVTLKTLRNLVPAQTIYQEILNIDLVEGVNNLGFYYIGMALHISIDNVKITKPPKKINILVNGDFQMFDIQNLQSKAYKTALPGWKGTTIIIQSDASFANNGGKNQVLVLSSSASSVTQTISFGKINKYSFVSQINAYIQNEASQLIAQNLLNMKTNSSSSISWTGNSQKIANANTTITTNSSSSQLDNATIRNQALTSYIEKFSLLTDPKILEQMQQNLKLLAQSVPPPLPLPLKNPAIPTLNQ